MKKFRGGIAVSLLALSVARLAAADDTGAHAAQPQDSPWRLGFALGYGMRSNPLIQSDDVPIVLDIDIGWFGKRFFFDNGDVGFTFMDNEAVTASVVGRLNSERLFFSNTDTEFVRVLRPTGVQTQVEVTVPDRDYAAELGFEVLADGPWGMLQLTAHHDVSGTHDGFEAYIDYGYGWRNQRWYIEPSLGVAFKSERLNEYYWGVRPEEASAALPSYRPGAGINAHARLLASYQMTREWAFSLAVEIEQLNSDAASSPLVAEREVLGFFAGFGYRF